MTTERIRDISATTPILSLVDGVLSLLEVRLLDRPAFGSTRVLTPQSTFADLTGVWLADLKMQRQASPSTTSGTATLADVSACLVGLGHPRQGRHLPGLVITQGETICEQESWR
jgi:hypothetical protein